MAARQGVDILMALVHAELTWQFSTLAKVLIIDWLISKFLWVITFRGTPAAFRLRRKPVAAPGGGDIYGSCDFFCFFCFFVSRDRVPSKPVDRFLHIVA